MGGDVLEEGQSPENNGNGNNVDESKQVFQNGEGMKMKSMLSMALGLSNHGPKGAYPLFLYGRRNVENTRGI